ncbi:superinfection immunity protein [Klebsiella pneumoniae]
MSVWHIIVLIFAMIIYVLPGVIASSREHKNSTAIWVLNIVLGWSFLGWIAALVWSFTNPGVVKLEPQVFGVESAGPGSVGDTKKCPYCAETIKKKQYCADFVAKLYKAISSNKDGINENGYGNHFLAFISHRM